MEKSAVLSRYVLGPMCSFLRDTGEGRSVRGTAQAGCDPAYSMEVFGWNALQVITAVMVAALYRLNAVTDLKWLAAPKAAIFQDAHLVRV